MEWFALGQALGSAYGSYRANNSANKANQSAANSLFADFYSPQNQLQIPAWLRKQSYDKYGGHLYHGLGDVYQQMGLRFQRGAGALNPNLTDAIRLRMAGESESIRRNQTNQQAETAGALGRRGIGSSGIAMALDAAIRRAGDRDMASARRQAILDSEAQRSNDERMAMSLTDQMLQWSQYSKGLAGQAAQLRVDENNRNAASQMAALSSLSNALNFQRSGSQVGSQTQAGNWFNWAGFQPSGGGAYGV